MDAPLYVSVSRLQVDPEKVDGLIDAFRGRAGLVDSFDGFVALEVWRSDRAPGEVLMVSHWRDRASFSAYMKSDAHRFSHDRIPADIDEAIRLERLDHLAGYEIVAR